MYQVLYPVEPPKSEPYRTMQWKSDICGSTLILFFYSCLQRNQMTLFKNVFSSVSFFEARSHTCNVLFSVKYHFKQFSLYRSFFFFMIACLCKTSNNSLVHLPGNVVNIQTGQWVGKQSGLGAGMDSFYEYLLKSYILFGEKEDYRMFSAAYASIQSHMRRG